MAERRRRRRRDPCAVGDLVARYRRGVAPPASTGAAADLAQAWADAAGALGGVTTVLRASRNGVVTIACADAAVAMEVGARADQLADALGHVLGERITGLRAVVADHVVPSQAPPGPRPPAPPSAAARDAARGLVEHIDDAAVREAVERAAAAALQQRWDQ